MPGRMLFAAIVLLLAGSSSSFAQQTDHWRVTVQDVSVHPLAVSADGKLVAGRGEQADSIFHVVNRQTSQTLLTVHLPAQILSAAIAESAPWCIVSTTQHIYRIDLNDGSAHRLLEMVAGAVAIDPVGQQLAVLGDLQVKQRTYFGHFQEGAQLGVYDLKQGRWRKQIPTPIKVNTMVTFDGDEVIAAGIGGRIGTRSGKGSFACHVQLNLTTGNTIHGKGEGGSNDFDINDDPLGIPMPGYEFPPAIKRLQASISAVMPRTPTEQAQFTAHSNGHTGRVLALVADDKRIAAVLDHGNAKRSLLKIASNGNIQTSDAKVASGVEVCGDRIVQEVSGTITDIETGKEILSIPQFKYFPEQRDYRDKFVGSGWIVRSRDRLIYYVPGHKGPVWEREFPKDLDDIAQMVCSPNGNRIVITIRNGDAAFYVVDATSGTLLMQPTRDPDKDSIFPVRQAAFNQDGSKLLVVYNSIRREPNLFWIERNRPDLAVPLIVHISSIREYDVASGQITYERILGKNEHYWSIMHTQSAWILGKSDSSIYLDEKTHQEVTIPFAMIDWATPIPGRKDEALLVENGSSAKAIVTPSGKVLGTWLNAWGGASTNNRLPKPTSGIAFGGKVLTHKTGTYEIEIFDAQTFDTIAWIHVIRLDPSFEWIVYTPDGHWDASPGAEKFVLATRNGSVVTPAELQSRRVPSLLQSRLPQ